MVGADGDGVDPAPAQPPATRRADDQSRNSAHWSTLQGGRRIEPVRGGGTPGAAAKLPLPRRTTCGTASWAMTSPRGPMLDSPSLRIAVRRGPLNVEDLRSTTVADDPVQRRDLILARACPCGRSRCIQRPRRVLPGPAVRSGCPDGARSRPGIGCHPGGVLLGLPEPRQLPRRQRQVVAQPHRGQRRDGHSARARSAVPSSPTRSSRTRAGSHRRPRTRIRFTPP